MTFVQLHKTWESLGFATFVGDCAHQREPVWGSRAARSCRGPSHLENAIWHPWPRFQCFALVSRLSGVFVQSTAAFSRPRSGDVPLYCPRRGSLFDLAGPAIVKAGRSYVNNPLVRQDGTSGNAESFIITYCSTLAIDQSSAFLQPAIGQGKIFCYTCV